jgi:hypothetical protein
MKKYINNLSMLCIRLQKLDFFPKTRKTCIRHFISNFSNSEPSV